MCESFGDGDTDGLSGRAPATPAASIGQVQFTQDEARITIIKVPETYDFSDGKYFFKRASQQCIERLLQHPPATFHAELKGTNREPHLEVVLQTSAVKLLPLLSDIHEEAIASEQPDGVTVPFNPPCSVWSLVTVLLLLEGDVTIEAWLGNLEHDVTLAARTLEMADFLRVTSLVEGIQEWLRGRIAVARSIGLSRKIWHNSQVLVAVPQRFCRSIFLRDRDPADTVRESIRLYAPVFCKWLQGSAPSLDLRTANLHLLDWTRLFSFLQDVPEVTELHVRGEAEVEVPTIPGSPRSPVSPRAASFALSPGADATYTLSDGFLKAIETAGQKMQLKNVQKLAFHSTHLNPDLIPMFQRALETLQDTLEHLTIHSPDFIAPRPGQKAFSAGDKWMFFRAVSKLSNLKTLRLPEALWKVLMSDGSDVADPLWRIEGLVVEDCESGTVLAPLISNSASDTSRSLPKVRSSSSDKTPKVVQ